MYFLHFLTALGNSLLLGFLFVFVFRRTGIRANFYFFLLAVLLGSWAGGLWLPPVGPRVAGVPWGSFFLSALILSTFFSSWLHRIFPILPAVPPRAGIITQNKKRMPKSLWVYSGDALYWPWVSSSSHDIF